MKLKEDYRVSAIHNSEFPPEFGGVMVTVIVERRAAIAKFDNGDIYDGGVWVEVFDILSEVNDPDDESELVAVIECNYPEAMEK